MNDLPTPHIDGYHAHVYYDPKTRPVAERLAATARERFAVEIGGFFDEPVGPHPVANLQIVFKPAEFAAVVPWLMLNRSGLDVLIHPLTDDSVRDHDSDGAWLGKPVPLRLHVLRRTYDPELLPSA
jgi:aromatic ring-cleaving dioxygenase